MQVSLIPPEMVEGLWPLIFPHLSRAAEYTFGRYEPEDIFEFVVEGNGQLWIVVDGDTVVGVTVTRFWQYPRKRCLDMVFLGGDDGFAWKEPMLETLQRWARDSGCDVIESSGRPAFSRVFRDDGYRMLWQVYEIPVTDTALGVSNG